VDVKLLILLRFNKDVIFYSEEDIFEYVSRYNGRKDCLISLYGFTDVISNQPVPESFEINKFLVVTDRNIRETFYRILESNIPFRVLTDNKNISFIVEADPLVVKETLKAMMPPGVQIRDSYDTMIKIPGTYSPSSNGRVNIFEGSTFNIDKWLKENDIS